MTKNETIYVKLLEEGIDVSRPVKAKFIEKNRYQILDKNSDIDSKYGEIWEFNENDIVECKETDGINYAIKLYSDKS